jgi:PAS domain S-box-containing protein
VETLVLVRRVFVALLFLAVPAMALDSSRAITQYALRSWQADDGMPTYAVTAIAQTQDGYLWFGTAAALGRFDGARIKLFDGSNTPALAKTRHIGAMLTARDGTLWLGRGDGLASYKDRNFKPDSSSLLSDAFIWSLAEGKHGELFVGTYGGGLHRLQNGKATAVIPPDGSTVWAIEVTRDGAVWSGTNGRGLRRWHNGKLTTFTTRDGLANNIVWALHEDHEGALWIGTNNGLSRFHNGTMTTFTTGDGLSNGCIKTLLEDRDGNLWIGTEGGGLNRYAHGKFASLGVEHGLVDATVLSLFEDREGNLWAGTGSGVTQLRAENIVKITTHEGLPNNSVMTVRESSDGSLLLGSLGGFTRWKNGEAVNVAIAQGLSSQFVRSVVEDPDGGVWLATNDGLNHYRDGKVKVYRTADGLPHDMVRVVARDREGSLWIGTRGGGVARLRDGVFTIFDAKGSLPHNTISSIDEDVDGSLWIATNGGLSVLKNGVFTNYGTNDGLSNAQVRMTYHDRDGTKWIGTFGGGLDRFKNGRFAPIRAKDGLFDDVVFSIVEDDAGYLWMTGLRGIFRVKKQELNEFADGKRTRVRSYAVGAVDGMRNAEVNAGLPASWKAKDGRLFFPTSQGLVIVDAKQWHAPPTPAIWNEAVLVQDQRVDHAGGVATIHPGQGRNVEIRYTAITFVAPRRVEFRYRLKGFSDEWVEAGSRRSAFYTNLRPGEYTFEVLASRGDGVWIAARNPIRIHIEAAFYETRWFALACALALAGIIGLMYRMRVALLKRRERMLVERVDEQTAQLRDANAYQQLILNSAGEGIYGLDANGIATFVNPAAARMLGWEVDALVGQCLHDIVHAGNALPREQCAVCSASILPATRGPETTTFRRRDGRTIAIEYIAGTLRGSDGIGSGVVVTFRDVSERVAIDQLKQEFVSTVSHELRTPLTSIRGALGLLGSGMLGDLADRGQRMLKLAISNTDRLTRLINDILDLERIDSGTLALNRESIAVTELIAEAADGVHSMAEEAGVTIICEPVDAAVSVDHDRMIQVVTNLLSNAIKFSPSGSTVKASATCDDDGVTIRVEDHGRGIPEEKFELIFERFKQVDASDARQKGGTGLGLAICRRIVELHGGRIWVETNRGGGSIFQFTIPAPRKSARVA